jgi:hypothetical protein
MSLRGEPADKVSQELRAVEREIDTFYESNRLVTLPREQAVWYLLAFLEEIIVREVVRGKSRTDAEQAAIADNVVVDSKAPLFWLTRSCNPGGQVPAVVDWNFYDPAHALVDLSHAYTAFESAFSWASMGAVELRLEGDEIKATGPIADDKVFEAYDRIGSLLDKKIWSFRDLRG